MTLAPLARAARLRVAGIPAGSTILAAYLYWGGSQTGATIDSTVTFAGSALTATRTFTTTFNNGGTLFPYFGGFADVTTRVTGNGNYTFSGLTVNTGAPHCGSQAVVAGWGLVVIYQRAAEDLRAINVFDGLQFFRGSSITLTPDGFRVPVAPINGKMAIVAWEGDPQNSTPLNGFNEQLSFNGNALDDGIVVPASDPTTQPYDGTVNTLGVATSYGVDVDTFNVDPYVSAGQTSATTVFSAGGDLVLLTAQVVSVTSEPSVDLSITKTHVGELLRRHQRRVHDPRQQWHRRGARAGRQHHHGDGHAPHRIHICIGHRHGVELQRRGSDRDLQSPATARAGRDLARPVAHGSARPGGGALEDQYGCRVEREPGFQHSQ